MWAHIPENLTVPEVGGPAFDVLSLFSGVGGLDLGIDTAVRGVRSVCYVEREAGSIGQLVARFKEGSLAEAPVWTDVCTFDGRPWRGLVDCVAGGFPCQDISLAGPGRGLGRADDECIHGNGPGDPCGDGDCSYCSRRSGLFFELIRIVREVRPRWVLLENVAALVTGKRGANARAVEATLAESGYHRSAWTCIRAADVGAPHGRDRVFILALADGADGDWWRFGPGGEQGAWFGWWGSPGGRAILDDGYDGVHGAGWATFAGRGGGGPDHLADGRDGGLGVSGAPSAGRHEPDGVVARTCGGDEGATEAGRDSRGGSDVADGGADGLDGHAQQHNHDAGQPGRQGDGSDRRHADRRHPQLGHAEGGEGDAARGAGTAGRGRPARGPGAELGHGRSERPQGVGAAGPASGAAGRTGGAALDTPRAFPPGRGGPGTIDFQQWLELLPEYPHLIPAIGKAEAESIVRRVADGLASVVGRDRTHALRSTGNGVVPLQAAVAIVVLAWRLMAFDGLTA